MPCSGDTPRATIHKLLISTGCQWPHSPRHTNARLSKTHTDKQSHEHRKVFFCFPMSGGVVPKESADSAEETLDLVALAFVSIYLLG